MKICLVGTKFFADGQTDTHDEAKSRFSQFCESASKRPEKLQKNEGVNEIKLAEASVIRVSNHFHEAKCSVEAENFFSA